MTSDHAGEKSPIKDVQQRHDLAEASGKTPNTLKRYFRQLRQSFPFFLKEIWRLKGLPAPCRVQIDMAQWLQDGPSKRGLRGFRGLSKTWITCAYICWRLFRNPHEKVLLVSASESHSKQSLFQIRGWLTNMPFLRHLAPRKGQRDNSEGFDVAGTIVGKVNDDRIHSVSAVGITGQLPGGRATLIVADDVEIPENTLTIDQRNKLRERVQEFEFILMPDGDFDIIYLGTPQHQDSLYDSLAIPEEGRKYSAYTFRTWPVQYPTPDEDVPALSPMLANDLKTGRAKPGDPVVPSRFDREYILGLHTGRTRFLRQMMLISKVKDENRYPLKLSDLIVYHVDPVLAPGRIMWGKSNHNGSTAIEEINEMRFGKDCYYGPIYVADQKDWIAYQGCKGYLDPAGAGADEMAWAIAGQLHGFIFLKALDAVQGGATDENLTKIVKSLRDNHCTELHVETNFGQDAFCRLLETKIAKYAITPNPKNTLYPHGWSCAVIGVHSTGQKEKRIINGIEPVMNQHRLIIDPAIAADTIFAAQMTNLSEERGCLEHDDRIEVVAGVVDKFADLLDQDAETQEELRIKQEQEEELRKYYEEQGFITTCKTWQQL